MTEEQAGALLKVIVDMFGKVANDRNLVEQTPLL